jgi:multiple antibiotic resistance protein
MMEAFQPWMDYTRFLIALTAVIDPFFAVPVFLSMTANQNENERRHIARVVSLTVVAVLIGAGLTGETVLSILGASLASFRVGGGIVLLLMALAMLNAHPGSLRQTEEEANDLKTRHVTGVVPLAVPFLAGPGAISMVIIAMQDGRWPHQAAIIACVLAVCLGLWLMLRLAARVSQVMGIGGLNVANRLLGLVLAGIAVETMAVGLKQLFPVLVANQ